MVATAYGRQSLPEGDICLTQHSSSRPGCIRALGDVTWFPGPDLLPADAIGLSSDLVAADQPQFADITLHVNDEQLLVRVDTRSSLLDVLREELGLTGSKKGCDHGQCGACTVLLEGRRANSCLVLAVAHDGARVTTIEGLANGEELHPVQKAFVEHDGLQCGYCTPGQICSAVGMLGELAQGWPSAVTPDLGDAPYPSREEIAERMSGNICRCGAYPGIVAAIEDVAR
jgi:xanthine dehydrogenase YagT iron-sulfur-binding subunit